MSRCEGYVKKNALIIEMQNFKHANIDMCSYIISVVYICRIISCLKGFALFYHIPHTYGMHMSLNFLRNKKREK